MGVNGIWLTPIYDNGIGGCSYGNIGINTIAPSLTGTIDYDLGWERLKAFIDKAHSKNIRVILDVVFRGVLKESQLVEDHSEWFETDTVYNGWMKFKWSDTSVNAEIFEYYPDHFKDTNICKVKAEGTDVQAYARYSSDTALIIVPNFTDEACSITVTVPFEEMALDTDANYKITDAVSGETIDAFRSESGLKITVKVNAMDQCVIKLSAKQSF